MKSFIRWTSCLAMAMVATAASAASGTFVLDGRLYSTAQDNKAMAQEMPIEAYHAFGTADGQPLFTVQDELPTAHSDVLDGEVNLWTVTDGKAVALTSQERVLGALWSDSLDRILYWTDEKQVVLIDRAGDARQVLLENAISPAISPDGQTLAYVATPAEWAWDDHSKAFEVRVRDLVTGEDRKVLHGTDAHQLIWTPDGRFLLFQASGTGVTSLWRVAAEGGKAEQLTNQGLWTAKNPFFVKNPSRATDVQWSEDGRKMLYGASYSEAGEVMVLELDSDYNAVRALQLTDGHSPFWLDNDTVLVPRPGVYDAEKSATSSVRFTEFPVSADFAESVIDVAGAPKTFERPERLTKAANALPAKAVNRYRYPLHSSAGHPYTAYYDNNGGGGQLDWRCGTYTYNNHRGTDIGVNGWWVYAGANGSLYTWNDGCPTVGYYGSTCGGGFGNYIKLSHGSASGLNWYTIYAHFRNGTVVASYHSCGSRVGISGSSGNSTGYHLHFEVNAYGHPYDDPFSGSCSGPVSYWCNQNGGYPTSSCC